MQQKTNLVVPNLDPVNMHIGTHSALDSFDLIGSMVAHDITERHGDTYVGNVQHGRVWCRPYASDATLYLDQEDKFRSAVEDPNSAHTNTIAMTLVRTKDKRVIDAAEADALIGETATSSIAFNTSTMQIAQGSAPNDVLTLAKIKTASFKLDQASAPDDEGMRFFYYAPGQKQAIMAITQAASSDFTAQRIYDSGTINKKFWMGFTWVQIPDVLTQNSDATITTLTRMLNLDAGASAGAYKVRHCLAMARAAMGYTELQGVQTYLDILPQKQHLVQARAKMDNNAVRVMQNGVVSVLASEQTA